MTKIEHVWCSFCEDRPAIGRMVIMRDKTRDQISELGVDNSPACDLHGRAWTGVAVAGSEVTGVDAVLQYVHPAYVQVTENHIAEFAAEKTCCQCGDPTEPIPLWAVDRILMAHPYLVIDNDDIQWEGICYECASASTCPSCSGDEDEDEEEGEHSGGDFSTHPYCQ